MRPALAFPSRIAPRPVFYGLPFKKEKFLPINAVEPFHLQKSGPADLLSPGRIGILSVRHISKQGKQQIVSPVGQAVFLQPGQLRQRVLLIRQQSGNHHQRPRFLRDFVHPDPGDHPGRVMF